MADGKHSPLRYLGKGDLGSTADCGFVPAADAAAAPPDPPATCAPNGRRSRKGGLEQRIASGSAWASAITPSAFAAASPAFALRKVGLFLLFVGAGSGFEPEWRDT